MGKSARFTFSRGWAHLAYFAEFLATAGIFDKWVKTCPLHYTSPNASRVRDVLGTLMLGVLSGSKRYAHLAGIRGDRVAAQALGLDKIVSEDSVRRALSAIEPEAAQQWMHQALQDSVIEALDRSWILDLDTTIKSLYGHQEGAEIGYNPHKPGRPSHALHTYWVGDLRLVLDMQLHSGKEHSSGHGKAGLDRLLEELEQRGPALAVVRGDCGYGNQDIIEICERHNRRYLLRLRKTANYWFKQNSKPTSLRRRKRSKPSMNCLPALQNKKNGLDARRLSSGFTKNGDRGGASGGLAGAKIKKFPQAKTSKTALLKGLGSEPLNSSF